MGWQDDPVAEGQAAPKRVASPEAFVAEYGPIAQKIGAEIGVDPNILLAKFGHETGWGKSVIPGTYNLGNIKDPSGKGVRAKDKREGSNDAYLKFDDPDTFATYYADFMKRMYPGAVGAGSDINKFTTGLSKGTAGSYASDPNYPLALRTSYRTVSSLGQDKEDPFKNITPTDPEELRNLKPTGSGPEEPRVTEGAELLGTALGAGKGILERGTDVYRPESEKAIIEAQKRLEIAQRNLVNPPSTGFDKAALEAEFRAAQTNLTQIEDELRQAQAKAAQAKIETRPPTTGGGGGIPTEAQHEQVQLGKVDEKTGATGRQKMGFNERTAQEAARREQISKTQQALQRQGVLTEKNVLAEAPGMTTTKGGIQVPSSAVYEDEIKSRQEAQKIAQQRATQGQEIERLRNEQKVRQKAAEEARKRVEAAQEAERKSRVGAQADIRKAEEALEIKQAGAPKAGGLSTAQKAGRYFAKSPVVVNTLGGLGVGLSVDEAVKRYQEGDYSGAVLHAIETALAGASMAPPAGPMGLAAKGVGTVGGLAMIPVIIAHDYLRKRGGFKEPE